MQYIIEQLVLGTCCDGQDGGVADDYVQCRRIVCLYGAWVFRVNACILVCLLLFSARTSIYWSAVVLMGPCCVERVELVNAYIVMEARLQTSYPPGCFVSSSSHFCFVLYQCYTYMCVMDAITVALG